MSVFKAVQAGIEEGAKRIKAYHGSPHNFDKFSIENIGTGEGAQAYGHGLYFAEREGTAKSYKNELSASVDYDGKPILRRNKQVGTTGDEDLDDSLIAELGDVDKSIKFWENDLQSDSDALRDYAVIQIEKLKNAKSKVKTTGGGHMYEVNIDASPDELLDYDLPIKNQPKNVQSAVYKSIETVPQSTLDNYFGGAKQNIISGDMTGRDFITNMEKATGNIDGGEYELAKRGIKGIKYADAQTRFSPKGRTNNYVIFDDKTIEIARKYGVSMPVAGAILAGAVTPEQAQAASIPKVTKDLMNKYFTPEAVEYATKQANARKSKEAITEIDIDDFLNLARDGYSPQKAEGIASVNQFDDLPFLSIKEEDGIANVIGHEGRHRARRLKEMGESKMPIRVRSDIRWDQQNDPKAFDFLHDYPRILFNEDKTKKTPFPFRQGEFNFIPSEFMDIQEIPRSKNQSKFEFTSSDDELLKKLGLASSAVISSGSTLASTPKPDNISFEGALKEREARKGMSRQERMKNPPSPELRKLARSEVLPTLGTMAQGALSGAAETIDYLSPVNVARLFADPFNEGVGRFFAPSMTQNATQTVDGLTDPLLYDERDPEAEKRKESAMMVGSLFSPI